MDWPKIKDNPDERELALIEVLQEIANQAEILNKKLDTIAREMTRLRR